MSPLAICQICGDALRHGQPQQLCESCETPHHRDCWEYAGGCSTYACPRSHGSWRAIAIEKVVAVPSDPLSLPPIAGAPTSGHAGPATTPRISYRTARVIKIAPPLSPIDWMLYGGHTVLAIAALVTFVVAGALGGSKTTPMRGPHGDTVATLILFIALGWPAWSVLHLFHDQLFTARRRPVVYFRAIPKSGDPREVCPATQIRSIRVVERRAEPTTGIATLYGVAVLLNCGDQVLVKEFDYDLAQAQATARSMSEAVLRQGPAATVSGNSAGTPGRGR
ncbi:MAG: hypothetical protein HY815_03105 [Candidatus Riflebacteria bacterium]|nr:hypothetical protein [Candidatus Riflebacteria bacterium]